jgi:hypothetical protein
MGVLSLGLFLHLAGDGSAGDPEIKSGIVKIAGLIEKGDNSAATAQAKALAKKVEDIDDVMGVFKPRTKKGVGVGKKPGAIQPDGIELQLNKISRDAPSQISANKDAEGFEQMAYVIAAVADVAMVKAPKDEGKKKSKDWVKWAKEMRDAAPELATAAKSKSPAEIQKAATKINNACNSCHSVFK